MSRALTPSLLVALGLSFTLVATGSAQVVHPRPELRLAPPIPAEVLSIANRHPLAERLDSLRRGYELVGEVGADESDPRSVLGRIADVAMVGERVFVVDWYRKAVLAFDLAGAFVTEIGRSGGGPGEFRQPTSVAIRDSLVFVGDRTREVEVYAIDGDGTESLRTIRLDGAVYDLCALDGALFVQAWTPGAAALLHRMTPEGTHESAFAEFYHVTDVSARSVGHALSEAMTVCDQAIQAVVIGPKSIIPEIRSYTASGEPRWRVVVEDYDPMVVEELPTGFRWTIPEEGYHRLQTMTRAFPEHLVIQIARVTRETIQAELDYERLDTYAVNAETGRGGWVSSSWPAIVAADGSCLVTKPNELIPRLEIYCAKLVGEIPGREQRR